MSNLIKAGDSDRHVVEPFTWQPPAEQQAFKPLAPIHVCRKCGQPVGVLKPHECGASR